MQTMLLVIVCGENTAYATIIRSALNEISVNSVKFP
jgi:hypothetical protein